MNRTFSRMPEAIAELQAALFAVKRPYSRYVTRTGIDTEITEHPGKYPRLAQMTIRFRKCFITNFMKERFPVWGESTSSKKASYVWIVSDIGSPVMSV
jgi:hypothetical protein